MTVPTVWLKKRTFYYRYAGGYSQRQLEESILNPAMREERVWGTMREEEGGGQADKERSQEGKRETKRREEPREHMSKMARL